jgi:NAD(P)-dependent dehydrogenase (short-subunit alcohol dehydrogenase family)
MSNTDKKVAIITGSGEGIGLGIALRFAKDGYAVIVAEIDDVKGKKAEAELNAVGTALFVHTDVANKDDIQNMFDTTLARFGRVDVLVNNALVLPTDLLMEDKTDAMLEQQLGIGVWGSWWTMQAARPVMEKQGGGRIINLSSIDIDTGAWLHSDYNIAKAGIQALTRSAAMEWARFNILVNCIKPIAASASFERMCDEHPGLLEMANETNPLGRMGHPEKDIAPVVAFLAGPDSQYVTGATIPVDGGLHLPRVNNKPKDLSIFKQG